MQVHLLPPAGRWAGRAAARGGGRGGEEEVEEAEEKMEEGEEEVEEGGEGKSRGGGRGAGGRGAGGRGEERGEESANFQFEGIVGSSHGLRRAPHLSAARAPALASRPRDPRARHSPLASRRAGAAEARPPW